MSNELMWAAWAKNASKKYTEEAISHIGTNMTYKGSKPTYDDLPIEGNKKGDCWTIVDTGAEYVWDGEQWIELGTSISPTWGNITGEISNQTDLKNKLDEKIKLLGNVDDPTDPGYGYPYHFPYDASFTPSEDKITIGLKTITLDNNKYKMTFNKELPAATENNIGLMKASDVKAIRTDIPAAIEDKQDKLIAGDNITIDENNKISATGGSSVFFDEKTIVKDSDNKYQTATGGWKEVIPEQLTDLFVDTKGDGSNTYIGPGSDKYEVGWDYNTTITSLVGEATTVTIKAKFTVSDTTFNNSVILTKSTSIPANWESSELTIGANTYKIKVYDNYTGENQGGLSLIATNESLDLSSSTMESFALVTSAASVTYHPIDNQFLKIDNSLVVDEDNKLKVNTNTIQSKIIAGNGIAIGSDGKTISIDSVNGIAIYETRIADANEWLTNGYVKTSNDIPTANLPSVCTWADRWGVLLYVAENNENKSGLQQYFPIDGAYKGRVFYRSVTGGVPNPVFGEWQLVPWTSEISNVTPDEITIINNTDNKLAVKPDLTLNTLTTTSTLNANNNTMKVYTSVEGEKQGTVRLTGALVMNSTQLESNIAEKGVALGMGCVVQNQAAVSIGRNNKSGGTATFSANNDNVAHNQYSFACGNGTVAAGNVSFVSGTGSVAKSGNQAVFGQYNAINEGGIDPELFIVGNGYKVSKGSFSTDELVGKYYDSENKNGNRYILITDENKQSVKDNSSIKNVIIRQNAASISKDGVVKANSLSDGVAIGTITDILNSILPSYTSEDNGKVLGVINGQLAWVSK